MSGEECESVGCGKRCNCGKSGGWAIEGAKSNYSVTSTRGVFLYSWFSVLRYFRAPLLDVLTTPGSKLTSLQARKYSNGRHVAIVDPAKADIPTHPQATKMQRHTCSNIEYLANSSQLHAHVSHMHPPPQHVGLPKCQPTN